MSTLENWSPDSWRSFPVLQQPQYDNEKTLGNVLERIRSYPPLIFTGEVETLKKDLAAASLGKRFLLQGGDCAERFKDCNREAITNKIKILLQMSVVLCYAAHKPIIRVGRIAGQYGKPRSQPTEKVDGQDLPVYRGDNVNDISASLAARTAQPERLLEGFQSAALTLNYIRALTNGGFADLHHPDDWNLDFVSKSPHWAEYEGIIKNIKNAISFMKTIGYKETYLSAVDFYTSHEGLILPLEEALTRQDPHSGKFYNAGAHMLWIGERTRQLDGAHVEYFRGIANPIGIKVGPKADPQEIKEVIQALNPTNEQGRITLITRMGEQLVEQHLPNMIESISKAKLNVCWSCDPMHGNAIKTKENVKTRDFNAILQELKAAFQIHRKLGSYLGGIHFELTGENVTECTGGAEGITAEDLSKSYETYCDPRLNYNQSLEMAFLISSMLEQDA